MEEKKLDIILEKINRLEKKVDDNNNILHGERNAKRWAKLFSIIKWIIIISMGIVAWSYISPFYTTTMETYDKIIKTTDRAGDVLDKIPKAEDFSFESLKKKFIK